MKKKAVQPACGIVYPRHGLYGFSFFEAAGLSVPAVFLFAVFAAVDLIFLICEDKHMIKLLLDGSDASWVLAFDYVPDLFGKRKRFFGDDLSVLNDVYSDIVINEAKDIQVHEINGAFNFHDIFLPHFATLCIFDNGNTAVQFVKVKVLVDLHAPACLDMVQHKAFGDASYV